MNKYTPEQIKEMARIAIQADKNHDVNFIALIEKLHYKTGIPQPNIKQLILRLSK